MANNPKFIDVDDYMRNRQNTGVIINASKDDPLSSNAFSMESSMNKSIKFEIKDENYKTFVGNEGKNKVDS
jgi:hypothetical protein